MIDRSESINSLFAISLTGYPVTSFHGQFVPSQFVPSYGQILSQNTQIV